MKLEEGILDQEESEEMIELAEGRSWTQRK